MKRGKKITIKNTSNTYSYAVVYPNEAILTEIALDKNIHITNIQSVTLSAEDITAIKDSLEIPNLAATIRDDEVTVIKIKTTDDKLKINAQYVGQKANIELPIKIFDTIAQYVKAKEVARV